MTEGAPAGTAASVGDIAYYAPWGNLAIYYKDAPYAAGVVKIGRIDAGIERRHERLVRIVRRIGIVRLVRALRIVWQLRIVGRLGRLGILRRFGQFRIIGQ